MQKINYISNKELLAEIQRSKASYCYFTDGGYMQYDAVVTSLDAITPKVIETAARDRRTRLTKAGLPVDDTASVIIRVMTDSHVPPETDEKRRKKSSTGEWIVRTNFPPFRHYLVEDGEPKEVGRSHWRGDFQDGKFAIDHGKMTRRLAEMFMLLVEQYSKRGNWRGYSYVSEMRGHALVQLSQVGLQFDESRSDNPFAWYTQIIKNCFRRTLLLEKRCQDIRDDLLVMAGAMPSYTRQVDNELDHHASMSEVHVVGNGNKSDAESNLVKKVPAKRGRKPKVKTP